MVREGACVRVLYLHILAVVKGTVRKDHTLPPDAQEQKKSKQTGLPCENIHVKKKKLHSNIKEKNTHT